MLELRELCKTFYAGTVNERKAIDHVNLTVPEGEFITLIGGNGAGKSTLLKLISGSYLPDSGSVTLSGKDVTYLPEHKRARNIGHLFQDPLMGTAPSMTIEENLSLAYLRGTHRSLAPATSRKNAAFFREKLRELDLGIANQSWYLTNTVHMPCYQNTVTEYFAVGEDWFAKYVEELKKAEHYIFMEYFIVAEGYM